MGQGLELDSDPASKQDSKVRKPDWRQYSKPDCEQDSKPDSRRDPKGWIQDAKQASGFRNQYSGDWKQDSERNRAQVPKVRNEIRDRHRIKTGERLGTRCEERFETRFETAHCPPRSHWLLFSPYLKTTFGPNYGEY